MTYSEKLKITHQFLFDLMSANRTTISKASSIELQHEIMCRILDQRLIARDNDDEETFEKQIISEAVPILYEMLINLEDS